MVGEVADGSMPIYWPKSRFEQGKAVVTEGEKKAGRPANAVEVVASLTTVINRDREGENPGRPGGTSW